MGRQSHPETFVDRCRRVRNFEDIDLIIQGDK